MCRALYAPMQVLCLADQKLAAMDKLNYYVLQTDRMLALYCKDAEERGNGLLTPSTIKAMDCLTSSGFSDNSGSEHEEFDDGSNSVNEEDDDDDDSILAHSNNQTGINGDSIEDDDDDEQ